MAQFEKHFVQDLTQDIKIRQCGTIVFNTDNLSNVITVDLYNGQEPYSGGGTVAGACICPDGSTVSLTGSMSGNTASVILSGDCFAFPGRIGIGVQVVIAGEGSTEEEIELNTVKTTVLKAIYNVELFETDTVVDPGSRITASVGQLVADIEAATAEIPASDMASLMSGIAPTFSTSTNYAAGAYVYYSGTLYRFTTAHAAGSWTGTDATAVVLGNDVADLKSIVTTVSGNIFSSSDVTETKSISTVFDVQKLEYNLNPPSDTKCVLMVQELYDTYYFEVTESQELYFGDLSSLTYVALGVVRQCTNIYTDVAQQIHFVGASAFRLRKSENNMPTVASPVSLNIGDVCIVTVPHGTNASLVPVYIFKQNVLSDTLLNNNVVLNSNQIKQINKFGYVQYVSGAGNDASTECANVFMPTYNGFIKYEFVHSVYATNHCNIWRIGRAYHVGDDFTAPSEITTAGEWEVAIKIHGRTDFAGGYNHGDEIFTSMSAYLNGANVDVTTLTALTPFEKLEFIQKSNLYDPNDGTTIFAEHGSSHLFDIKLENNLMIKQTVYFLSGYDVDASYMAMFPILKSMSDKIYTDRLFEAEDITLPKTLSKVSKATMYKTSAKCYSSFGIEKYPAVDSTSGNFFMTDNSGNPYNKCYYYVCGNNARATSGTFWQSVTTYNLSVSE